MVHLSYVNITTLVQQLEQLSIYIDNYRVFSEK